MQPIFTIDQQAAGRLFSITRPISATAPLTFLAHGQGQPRVLWQDPHLGLSYAGFGSAWQVSAAGHGRFTTVKAALSALFDSALFDREAPEFTTPHAFGGFAFIDDHQQSKIWSAFPSALFLVPAVQLSMLHDQTWLTLNRFAHNDDEIDLWWNTLDGEFDRLEDLLSSPLSKGDMPTLQTLRFPLSEDGWRAMITEATDAMRAGYMNKVVLARTSEALFDRPVDPLRAMSKLDRHYSDTYRFLIEPIPGQAFFGATPELLIRTDGDAMWTAAVAGSRRRGLSQAEDAALAEDMLTSEKERYEHEIVVKMLRERLSAVTTALHMADEPDVLRLSNIQHLYTPVRGTLRESSGILDLVQLLHPTPALGGSPRDRALAAIATLERSHRGWYASPVGWVNAQGDGTFAVAIRSAISKGDRARLYAGAGIVADSEADKEWDETAVKFKPLMDALMATEGVRDGRPQS